MAEKEKFKIETVTLGIEGFLLEYVYLEDRINVKVKDLGLGESMKTRVPPALYLKELVTRHLFLNDRIKFIDIQPDNSTMDKLMARYMQTWGNIRWLYVSIKVRRRTCLPISIHGRVV